MHNAKIKQLNLQTDAEVDDELNAEFKRLVAGLRVRTTKEYAQAIIHWMIVLAIAGLILIFIIAKT